MDTTNTQHLSAAEIADLPNAMIHHARRKKAADLQTTLEAEYPGVVMLTVVEEGRVSGFVVYAADLDGHGGDEILRVENSVPELADILEAAEDAGIDPEEGAEEEEEERGGSVVPEAYRQRYREVSSTGQSNGDWLAEQLAIETHGVDGFRPDDFAAILVQNEVDQSGAWARLPESGQRGWVGRWRMNGRQQLEKMVALRGVYRDLLGNAIVPPTAFLDQLRATHGKWIAKQEKLTAALKQE